MATLEIKLSHKEARVVIGRMPEAEQKKPYQTWYLFENNDDVKLNFHVVAASIVGCSSAQAAVILGIIENYVAPSECPICQEADIDKLVWDTNEKLHCSTCMTVFDPNVETWNPNHVLYKGENPADTKDTANAS